MTRVYLMRHGIAIDRADPDCPPEAERDLTDEGRRKTESVARGLARMAIEPEVFLSSPFRRARETAEITARLLGFPLKKVTFTETLLPNAPPAHLYTELKRLGCRSVICFGHAPHIDDALAVALGAELAVTRMKKSAVAALDLDSLAPPKGRLLWLVTSKTFR